MTPAKSWIVEEESSIRSVGLESRTSVENGDSRRRIDLRADETNSVGSREPGAGSRGRPGSRVAGRPDSRVAARPTTSPFPKGGAGRLNG